MTDMEIVIALEPDTLELTFDLSGGSAPQPMPVMPILECTQAEYDAMQAHDSSTLYAIPEVV
jgi:hypothetical protein